MAGQLKLRARVKKPGELPKWQQCCPELLNFIEERAKEAGVFEIEPADNRPRFYFCNYCGAEHPPQMVARICSGKHEGQVVAYACIDIDEGIERSGAER